MLHLLIELKSLLLYVEDYVEYDDVDFDIDYKRIIQHLVSKGIDTGQKNNEGISAYSLSKRLGNKGIIELLRNDFSAIDDIIENVEKEDVTNDSFHKEDYDDFEQNQDKSYKVGLLSRLFKPKE